MIECNVCGKEFPSKKSMTNHRRWHDLPEYKQFQDKQREVISNMWKGVAKPKEQIDKAMKNRRSYIGKQNPNWKGDKVGESAVHVWVKKHKKKPELCEICGKKRKLYLSFEHSLGDYTRNPNNYEYLCVFCHKKKDGDWDKFLNSGIPTRFKRGVIYSSH